MFIDHLICARLQIDQETAQRNGELLVLANLGINCPQLLDALLLPGQNRLLFRLQKIDCLQSSIPPDLP